MIFLWSPLLSQDHIEQAFDDRGFSLAVPDGWEIVNSSPDEVVIRMRENRDVSLSVIRFEIADENRLGSELDIHEAVAGLYSELGIAPESFENVDLSLGENRTTFGIEYVAGDSTTAVGMRVNLKGIIVRSSEGPQIFFLLRGYTPVNMAERPSPGPADIIASFKVTMPLADSLFPKSSNYGYFFLFFVILLMAFFYARNRKIQKSRNPLGGDSRYFWRCSSCQLANHIENHVCQRCGAERTTVNDNKR